MQSAKLTENLWMTVKTSAAHLSRAKVLVIVAVLAYLATNVITVDLMSKWSSRRSDALKSLNALHNNVPVKRHLNANAAMTATDRAGPSEERYSIVGLDRFGTRLKSFLSAIESVILKTQV
ncbi:unnamed protein product [Peronospora belbahrii]|uniref:Uncharacterized protein n=1 Tax=Peronospora belbahrii TaxID=622444 RepID=A0AAU9L8S1_9STRA|nr:unnamed protein product [Peronospora belbahrii]